MSDRCWVELACPEEDQNYWEKRDYEKHNQDQDPDKTFRMFKEESNYGDYNTFLTASRDGKIFIAYNGPGDSYLPGISVSNGKEFSVCETHIEDEIPVVKV